MTFKRFYTYLKVALVIFFLIQQVSAGPGGFIELVNLTPYEWRLTAIHNYHMAWNFPPSILAGSTCEEYFEYWYHWGDNGDCGAEATYELVGSITPASFTIKARQSNGKRIEVQFNDDLSSVGNPAKSLIDLGYQRDGSVLFVLSGNETGSYVSSNPPAAWMQATLPTIGKKPLREIVMPASHDAGMSEVTRAYGGHPHNTATQSVHIYQQLINGARWFDIRPAHRNGKWYTGHFSVVGSLGQQGGFGRTIDNIIKDINRFTSEHPGELIIADISHELDRASLKWRTHFSPELWQKLYTLLDNGINDLWTTTETTLPDDLSSVPLSTFIKPGSKSAVLIRLPNDAPAYILTLSKREVAIDSKADRDSDSAQDKPDIALDAIQREDGEDNETQDPPTELPHYPRSSAFISARCLKTVGSYSNTQDPSFLERDQLTKLSTFRPSPQTTMFQSTWTITQKKWQYVVDVANTATSIIALAIPAQRKLFSTIWRGLSSNTYPNLIEVDDIRNSQVTALCMAINNYFAMGKDMVTAIPREIRIKGRSTDEIRESHTLAGKRAEWLGRLLWCALSMQHNPCWTDFPRVPSTLVSENPSRRIMEITRPDKNAGRAIHPRRIRHFGDKFLCAIIAVGRPNNCWQDDPTATQLSLVSSGPSSSPSTPTNLPEASQVPATTTRAAQSTTSSNMNTSKKATGPQIPTKMEIPSMLASETSSREAMEVAKSDLDTTRAMQPRTIKNLGASIWCATIDHPFDLNVNCWKDPHEEPVFPKLPPQPKLLDPAPVRYATTTKSAHSSKTKIVKQSSSIARALPFSSTSASVGPAISTPMISTAAIQATSSPRTETALPNSGL